MVNPQSKCKSTGEALIKKYDLAAHPEGGYYKEIFRSKTILSSPVHSRQRNAATHIYFLLGRGDISRFHKVLHDEIWNFYEGAPLKLICFDGKKVTENIMGPGCNSYTAIVNGGVYQAAVSTGDYSLVGCTVAPGFDFNDFSFLKDSPRDLEPFTRVKTKYNKFL